MVEKMVFAYTMWFKDDLQIYFDFLIFFLLPNFDLRQTIFAEYADRKAGSVANRVAELVGREADREAD